MPGQCRVIEDAPCRKPRCRKPRLVALWPITASDRQKPASRACIDSFEPHRKLSPKSCRDTRRRPGRQQFPSHNGTRRTKVPAADCAPTSKYLTLKGALWRQPRPAKPISARRSRAPRAGRKTASFAMSDLRQGRSARSRKSAPSRQADQGRLSPPVRTS